MKRRWRFDPSRFYREQRANWSELVPEIAYVLFLCDAVRDRVDVEEIAEQAVLTYPQHFFTRINGKKIPDLSLILLTLNEAKKRGWGYAAGDWFKGWRLTGKGLRFARDVERRRRERVTQHVETEISAAA